MDTSGARPKKKAATVVKGYTMEKDTNMKDSHNFNPGETSKMNENKKKKNKGYFVPHGGLIVILFSLALIAVGWQVAEHGGCRGTNPSIRLGGEVIDYSINIPKPAAVSEPAPAPKRPTREELETLFSGQIAPMIEEMHEADKAAMERALAGFHTDFGQFHQGIAPFTEDLTRYGTRFRTMKH